MGSEAMQLKFIAGTEGQPDYLVVCQIGTIILGIKPMLKPTMINEKPATLFMFRVRAAHTKKDMSSGDVAQFLTEQTFDEAFPDIPFKKSDDKRASLELGCFLIRGVHEGKAFDKAYKDLKVVDAMTSWVQNHIPEGHGIVTEKEMTKWVQRQFQSVIDEVQDHATNSNPLPDEVFVGPIDQAYKVASGDLDLDTLQCDDGDGGADIITLNIEDSDIDGD